MSRPAPAGPLRAIDLFCGAGGLTQGLRDAGFDVRLGLDKDKDAIAAYKLNHPDATVVEASITDLSADEILALAGGHVDVVVGGPSCQGFSTAGRRNGWVRDDDERNQLWSHMLGVVRRVRPKAFLMENVPGLVYWKSGEFGERIIKGFEALGYTVESHILLAADYGVPQRRRRMFLVGLLGDKKFEFPEPTHMGGWRRDSLEKWEAERERRGLLRHISCWEAIGDLPRLDGTGRDRITQARLTPYMRLMRQGRTKLYDHETHEMSDAHLELIRHVPQGGTWRDIPPHLLPDRFRGMRRTDSTNLIGRLEPTLPSYTMTTQFTNVTVGCNIHPYEDRALTVREAARLQSFPDRYRFVGTLSSRARQIGNAVPPLLAQVLASEIARQISPQKARHFHPRPTPMQPAAVQPVAASDSKTSARMKKQRRTNTKPEILIRSALHAAGLRFRVGQRPIAELRRTADIVFPGAQVAVFVDGCFWHGCPEHSRDTKSNTKWWADKIAANKERDLDTVEKLTGAGWTVVRVWEHEDPAVASERIVGIVAPPTDAVTDGVGA